MSSVMQITILMWEECLQIQKTLAALLTNIEGGGLIALEANYHLNSGAGIIVFSDKRKLWYTDGKEKIKERAYVRT